MNRVWWGVIVAVLVWGAVCPAWAIEQGAEADAEVGALPALSTIYDELSALGGAVPIVSKPAPTAPAVTPPTAPAVDQPNPPTVTPPNPPTVTRPNPPTVTPPTPPTVPRPNPPVVTRPNPPVVTRPNPPAATPSNPPAGEVPALPEFPPDAAAGMTNRSIGELDPLPLYQLTTPPLDAGSGAPSQTVVLAGEVTPSGAGPATVPAPTAAASPLSDQVKAILETARDYLVIIAIVLAGTALVSVLVRILYQRWKARPAAAPAAGRPVSALDVTIPAATPPVPVAPLATVADLDHLFDQALNRGTVPAAVAQLNLNAPIPHTQPLTTQEETMQEAPGLLDYEAMKYRQVYQYASEGLDPVEIARKTGFGEGEIGLVLDLYRLQNG